MHLPLSVFVYFPQSFFCPPPLRLVLNKLLQLKPLDKECVYECGFACVVGEVKSGSSMCESLQLQLLSNFKNTVGYSLVLMHGIQMCVCIIVYVCVRHGQLATGKNNVQQPTPTGSHRQDKMPSQQANGSRLNLAQSHTPTHTLFLSLGDATIAVARRHGTLVCGTESDCNRADYQSLDDQCTPKHTQSPTHTNIQNTRTHTHTLAH